MADIKTEKPPAPAPAIPYVAGRLFKLVNLTLSLIIVGIIFLAFEFKWLDKVELFTLDLRFKLRGIRKGSPEIVHIDMDEASISHIGRWPWSREWHASLITILSECRTKITAFDIFFSEPTPLTDFFLVEATRLAKNVVYALAFEFTSNEIERSSEQVELLSRFAISESQIIGDKKNIPQLSSAIAPLTELYATALTAGHVITVPDPDGAIRRAPTIIGCRGSFYLHFSLETALAYLGINRRDIKIVLGKYIDLGGGIKIPIDEEGFMIVNWTARWQQDFKHYPYWEILASYQKKSKGEKPLIPLENLKDKICLIGLTATGLIDIKPIPLQPAYPIVGMHTNIIDMILQKKFIRQVNPPVNLLIIMLLSILIGAAIPRFRPIGGAVFTITIILVYLLSIYMIFKFAGLWISIIYPLSGVCLSFVSVMIHAEIANALERARLFHLAVEDGLTKLYVVRHFKEILEQEMAKAKRYQRPLSLIISDIDHFKRVNDTYGHLSGDFILRETANIFKSSCREADIAGRYGGEEFVILLPETNRDGAVEFAERLRKLVEGLTLEYNNIKFNITISFGITELRDDVSVADFIKRADEALYVAKETGRNKVCFG